MKVVWLCVVLMFGTVLACLAGELGLNVYGISYHPDERDSEGNSLEEFNPGAGIAYLFYEKQRSSALLEGGIFRNSNADLSGYLSVGYRFRVAAGFGVGAAVMAVKSSSIRENKWTPAVLPVVYYRYRSISLQLLYAPRYRDWNRNAVFGMYATWYLFHL